ncbi:MAG: arginine deiminase family protein [Actinomycetota bacterium]|nr:arginine deiminase family protein [Actinomycetota bacterium]
MAGPLLEVAMRRPGAILTADADQWHYAKPIDADALVAQYEAFVDLLETAGAHIHWLPDDEADGLADSMFTFDPSFVIPAGAITLRPGKQARRAEAELHRSFYEGLMPIVGTVEAPGVIEGGDCCWLDPTTLVVGRGFRTNQAGIDQLAAIVATYGIDVEAYDLSYGNGPDACLHLLSLINPLDTDLALVHAPLMPVALHDRMVEMGYELIDVPADEYEASAGLSLNVLAVGPRRCIAIDGFPQTVDLMRTAGCDVTVFRADELCLPCEGGPTCLTRPMHRVGSRPRG